MIPALLHYAISLEVVPEIVNKLPTILYSCSVVIFVPPISTDLIPTIVTSRNIDCRVEDIASRIVVAVVIVVLCDTRTSIIWSGISALL